MIKKIFEEAFIERQRKNTISLEDVSRGVKFLCDSIYELRENIPGIQCSVAIHPPDGYSKEIIISHKAMVNISLIVFGNYNQFGDKISSNEGYLVVYNMTKYSEKETDVETGFNIVKLMKDIIKHFTFSLPFNAFKN